MKIGLANRAGILGNPDISISLLQHLGVGNIELYVEASKPLKEGVEECVSSAVKQGFAVSIHATGHLADDLIGWAEFLLEAKELGIQTVVFHPCERWGNRFENETHTTALCQIAHSSKVGNMCLENLPHDPTRPQRFGDSFKEVAAEARLQHLALCLDTGHYLAGVESGYSQNGLRADSAKLVQHIHLHTVVDGKDHQWPCDDDGMLADLIDEFLEFNSGYNGVWSFECIPGPDPIGSLQQSVAWLNRQLNG